ncbi:hypothetical protein CEXT_587491, partial [Caerostris extrusa]
PVTQPDGRLPKAFPHAMQQITGRCRPNNITVLPEYRLSGLIGQVGFTGYGFESRMDGQPWCCRMVPWMFVVEKLSSLHTLPGSGSETANRNKKTIIKIISGSHWNSPIIPDDRYLIPLDGKIVILTQRFVRPGY